MDTTKLENVGCIHEHCNAFDEDATKECFACITEGAPCFNGVRGGGNNGGPCTCADCMSDRAQDEPEYA